MCITLYLHMDFYIPRNLLQIFEELYEQYHLTALIYKFLLGLSFAPKLETVPPQLKLIASEFFQQMPPGKKLASWDASQVK